MHDGVLWHWHTTLWVVCCMLCSAAAASIAGLAHLLGCDHSTSCMGCRSARAGMLSPGHVITVSPVLQRLAASSHTTCGQWDAMGQQLLVVAGA